MPLYKKNTKEIIHLLIGIFFMFVLGSIIPTWGGITRVGVQTICIFIGTIYLINAHIGLIVSSMLCMLAIVFTGFYSPEKIISSTFGSANLFQLFLVYVLCYAITDSGAGNVMVNWLLSRKILIGRPVLFLVVFFESAALFSCLVGSTGSILFFITMTDALSNALEYENDSQFKRFVLCAAFVSASLGSPTLPFKGSGLMVFGLISEGLKTGGVSVDFGAYIISGLMNQIVFAFVIALLAKPLFQIDLTRLKNVDFSKLIDGGEIKMNACQAWCFWGFIVACAYSIVLLLPIEKLPWYGLFKSIGQAFVFGIMICILSLVRIDGNTIINPSRAFKEGIRWDVIFAYAAFSTIGGMLANEEIGIKSWIGNVLSSMFGEMSFFVFALSTLAITFIVTNFFSNMATGLLMGALASPYLVSFGLSLNINPSCIAAGIAGLSCVAYLTMGAGNMSAVFLGQECMLVRPKWIGTWGLLIGIICVLCTTVVLVGMSFIL